MALLSRVALSGSTNGRPINVGTTSTTVHDATSTANEFDEYHLWATNTTAAAVDLTMEVGGTAFPDAVTVSVPANSTIEVLPGLQVGSGVNVDAKAASASAIAIHGYILRINQA